MNRTRKNLRQYFCALILLSGWPAVWGNDGGLQNLSHQPGLVWHWAGATQGEAFLNLKQIQLIRESSDNFLGRQLDELVFGQLQSFDNTIDEARFSPSGLGSEALKSELFLIHWPESGQGAESFHGWTLAWKNAPEDSPLDQWFEKLTTLRKPSITQQKSEDGGLSLSLDSTSGSSRITCGKFNEWTHFSIFHGDHPEGFSPGYHLAEVLSPASGGNQPQETLFSVSMDAQRYRASLGQLDTYFSGTFPKISLTGTVASSTIRISGTFDFDEDVDIDLHPWRLPVETLRDPIVSLTAVRGLNSVLGKLSSNSSGLVPAVDQFLMTGEFHGQFSYGIRAFLPVPTGGAQGLEFDDLKSSAHLLMDGLLQKHPLGKLVQHPTLPRYSWLGLPIIIPYVEEISEESNGRFVEFGSLPINADPKPIPEDLINQLRNTENLIAYDWELTPLRATQLTSVMNIMQMVEFSTSLATVSKTGKVILKRDQKEFINITRSLSNLCENTVTFITRKSPRQWAFQRSGNLGLNSIEIIWLAHSLTVFSDGGREIDAPVLIPPPGK